MALSKNQIDKLGERLRDSKVVSDEDLALLQEVRAMYEVALAEVTETLAEMEHQGERLRPTSRLKTVGTLIDKLRRESARLSQVDDIAGARVVVDGSRVDQDEIVAAIRERFPQHTVKDRRERPSYGYRAVHVIATVGMCRIEIQVRTVLQDLWAQTIDVLSDIYGRALRYGGPPVDPQAPFADGTRQDFVNGVIDIADAIDTFEQREARGSTSPATQQVARETMEGLIRHLSSYPTETPTVEFE